jgi:hypothetical protein
VRTRRDRLRYRLFHAEPPQLTELLDTHLQGNGPRRPRLELLQRALGSPITLGIVAGLVAGKVIGSGQALSGLFMTDEVVAKLNAIATTGYEERIYVRGDTNADYGTVMKVMARVSAAGFKNLGLVTLQEQEK